MAFYPRWNKTSVTSFGGTVRTAALLHGSGTASAPTTTATADKNFMGYWVKSTAATGDARALYARMYFGGAGSGEAVRAYATAAATNVATGGTVNGIHASLSVNASASISGQGFGGRFTIDEAADTRTISGNVGAILAESNIGANNTVPATVALIHFKEIGTVACKKAFRFPNVASAGMVAAHTTETITHSVRCVTDDGTVLYLMATNDASHRTGGA